MQNIDDLQKKIEALEKELKPLQDELRKHHISEYEQIEEKLKLCDQNKYKFVADELTFSAISRCPCGAGLAYPNNCSPHGYWDCSAILMGVAEKVEHTAKLPFAFYDVKSEKSNRWPGATTRPK
jgi:hypothetical protein